MPGPGKGRPRPGGGEYDRRRSIRFGRFYLRRALRLLPAFLVYVGVANIYVGVAEPSEEAAYLRGALIAVLYLANWPALRRRSSSGSSWPRPAG